MISTTISAPSNNNPEDSSVTGGLSSSELTDVSCVVQCVPAMIYTYTVNHDTGENTFPFVSDYCEKIFGLPAAKIINDSEAFVNLVHPDDVNTFASSVLESMINLTVWDHKMRMKDVHSRIVYVHGKSIPRHREITNDDGTITKLTIWSGVLTDITNYYDNAHESNRDHHDGGDYKEQHEEGSTSTSSTKDSSHQKACLDSHLPCFEVDENGTILSCNDHMIELTHGILKEDLVGRHVNSLVPDSKQGKNEVTRFLADIKAAFLDSDNSCGSSKSNNNNNKLSSSSEFSQDFTILSKIGTELHLRVSCKRNNLNNSLSCSCTDVTPLKEAERGKKEAEKEARAALRLLDAEKNLTEWLSHEIRNPLSIAMEAAKTLREHDNMNYPPSMQAMDRIYEISSNESDCFIDLIIQSISYVVDLLSQTLDLNKVAEGKLLLRPSTSFLRKDIFEPIYQMMHVKGNSVSLSISGDEMSIYIDKLRLKQVITNLISNALKFTKEGFISINWYRTNKDVNGDDIPDSLLISVSDSGVGIPPGKSDKLFSKWEQLGTSVNGAGIGLCLSRFLVIAMGGEIYLNENYHSNIDGSPGAQFIVRFSINTILASEKGGCSMHNVPAYTALKGAVKSTSQTEQSNYLYHKGISKVAPAHGYITDNSYIMGKYRILLVDDVDVVRKFLRRRFSKIFPEASIFETNSGESAIEITSSGQYYDIILMDQFMGDGLNGDETIRKLRSNGVSSFIIGFSANSKEMCHKSAGAQDFFQKPLPSQEIVTERLIKALPSPAGWRALIVDELDINCHFLKRKLWKAATCHFTTYENAEKNLSIISCTSVKDAITKLKSEWFDLIVTGQEFKNDNDQKGIDIISFARSHGFNKNAIIVLNSATNSCSQRPQLFNFYWPKPLPSEDDMRKSICHELIRSK